MIQSHTIDIDGRFIGAAIRLHDGYRFVAVDPRLEEIDASHWPSLDALRRVARRLLSPRPPQPALEHAILRSLDGV
jgi:hypothetical protein